MTSRRTWYLSIVMVVLLLAILACGRGEGQEPAAPRETEGGGTTTLPEAGATSTPEPGACADAMAFIADVSVPDGTIFGPNEPFIKTWRIQNVGECDWSGYQIVFDSGEPMGNMEQAIPDTPAGEELDISLEMTSPGGPGDYTGRWRIESAGGANLGHVTCVIVVEVEEPEEEEEVEEPETEGGEGEAAAAPNPPTNLRMPAWGMDTITLEWDDNSDNEDGFRVVEADLGPLTETAPDVTSVEIDAPPCGETFRLRVRAFNAAGLSAFSNTVEAEGFCQPSASAPEAPGNLRVSGWGMNTVTVAWDDNSDNEESFRITERDRGRIGEVDPDVTSFEIDFTAIGAEPCETLNIRVRAFNAAGTTDSNVIEYQVPGACP